MARRSVKPLVIPDLVTSPAPVASVVEAEAPPELLTWERWLADVSAARTFETLSLKGLWEGVRPADRSLLLANAKARLADRTMSGDPWREQPNADPPHLYHPKFGKGVATPQASWLNVATASTGVYPMHLRMVAGIKAEVVAIDGMLVTTAHTMHRNGFAPAFSVPDGVDRAKVMPAATYDAWLAPEPWQTSDRLERDRISEPRRSIDLLATPTEIAEATQWPASRKTDALRAEAGTLGSDKAPVPTDSRRGLGLGRFFLALVERKAQLLSVLRGVASGLAYDDPSLWAERPWIAEFRPYGLFPAEPASVDPVASSPSRALVDDLVRRLLEPGGLRLVDDLVALEGRLAATRGGTAGSVLLDGGPLDPPTRVQVTGRAARPRDARLSRDDRRRIFGDAPVVPGCAADPDFVLPVGCVIVLPAGRPPFLRGRGWSTTATGRLLAAGRGVDHPDRVMPFHLPPSLRDAALKLGPLPATGFSPGPDAVYYRGYRWVLRRGGGPRRWDETESEGVERAERAFRRTYAAIEDGWPGPTPLNPFRLPGRADMWPFGSRSSDGPLPDQLRELFTAVGGPYDPAAFGPGPSREAAWSPPPPMAFPGSWDRSWENAPAFEGRWARASIPPEVLQAPAFARRLGSHVPSGSGQSIPEVLAEVGAKVRDGIAEELARSGDTAYVAANRAAVSAARERAALMHQIDDEEAQRHVEWERAAVGRIHRERGRDASAARRRSEGEIRAKTCRLAYVPDPEVDGASARAVVVDYDPAFRPEPLPGVYGNETRLLEAPPVDHALGPDVDAPANPGSRPPYRPSEVDRYARFFTGEA